MLMEWEQDVRQDREDLEEIIEGLGLRLCDLKGHGQSVGWPMLQSMEKEIEELRMRLAEAAPHAEANLYVQLEDPLRRAFKMLAWAETAAKWHSETSSITPPFLDLSPLFVKTGFNDYDRGFVEFEFFYDQHFRTYYQLETPLERRGLLFSCGMGAIETVLKYVWEAPMTLAVGQRTYHETQLLIALYQRNYSLRVIPFDESQCDQDYWIDLVKQADLLICDTISMNREAVRLDIERIYQAVRAADKSSFGLILDNTVLGPELFLRKPPLGTTVFLVESLIKNYQLGLDMASAGSLQILGECDYEKLLNNLERLRGTMGTNINPYNAHLLPQVPRALILRRLRRQQRNAARLFERLHSCGDIGLLSHSGLLFIRTDIPQELMDLATLLAASRGIRLLKGTSFGFNATHVSTVPGDEHCVRISCGMETEQGIGRIAQLIIDACTALEDGEVLCELQALRQTLQRLSGRRRADDSVAVRISSALEQFSETLSKRITNRERKGS